LIPELAFDSSFLKSFGETIFREKVCSLFPKCCLEAHPADFFDADRRSDIPWDDTFQEITELLVVAFDRLPFVLI
jgi:hypothetical protein